MLMTFVLCKQFEWLAATHRSEREKKTQQNMKRKTKKNNVDDLSPNKSDFAYNQCWFIEIIQSNDHTNTHRRRRRRQTRDAHRTLTIAKLLISNLCNKIKNIDFDDIFLTLCASTRDENGKSYFVRGSNCVRTQTAMWMHFWFAVSFYREFIRWTSGRIEVEWLILIFNSWFKLLSCLWSARVLCQFELCDEAGNAQVR